MKQDYQREKIWTDAESIVTYKNLIENSEGPQRIGTPDTLYQHMKIKRFMESRVKDILDINI